MKKVLIVTAMLLGSLTLQARVYGPFNRTQATHLANDINQGHCFGLAYEAPNGFWYVFEDCDD